MLINASLKKVTNKTIVVVANERQVIAFKNTYIKQQQKETIALPKVFSWQNFLVFVFNQIKETPYLISPLIQQTLWQEIITETHLFKKVLRDYQLIHQYKIPENAENFKAYFFIWLKKYQQKLKENNWIDKEQLCIFITEFSNEIPQDLCFYGFNNFTPEMQGFLQKFPHTILKSTENKQTYQTKIYPKLEDELLDTALWAKQKRAEKDKTIAIVVDDLETIKTPLSLIFDTVLHQQNRLYETRDKEYNISFGRVLIEYPLIMDCFNILNFCHQYAFDKIEPELAKKVFLSPFFKDFEVESQLRAEFVQGKIFKKLSLKNQTIFLNAPPKLAILLETLPSKERWSQIKNITDWVGFIQQLLNEVCFSANIPDSSTNYQLLTKLRSVIFDFNQLLIVNLKLDSKQILNLLEQSLKETIFQPQAAKTNIHILGLLEVQGLFFDEVRFIDFNQKVLPQSVKKPEFITYVAAKQYHLPNITNQSCFEQAENLLSYLQQSGANISFSFSVQKDDLIYQRNTLIDWTNGTEVKIEKLQQKQQVLENFSDEIATPLLDKKIKQGVAILSAQAMCPFQGFAKRLNISNEIIETFGFSTLEKGSLLHKTLEFITLDHPNQTELAKLSDKDIQGFIKKAIEKYPKNKEIIKLEKQRLFKLIKNFLALEQQRDDFEIVAIEQKQTVNINGLEFAVRLDRMDEMAGKTTVFDYKSSLKAKSLLTKPPLKDSQLPIYAINNIDNKPDTVSFIGLSLAEIKYVSVEVEDYQEMWQTQLEKTSLNFQNGVADVSPEKGACEFCGLQSLCRIS